MTTLGGGWRTILQQYVNPYLENYALNNIITICKFHPCSGTFDQHAHRADRDTQFLGLQKNSLLVPSWLAGPKKEAY